jgi:hypothetical protein
MLTLSQAQLCNRTLLRLHLAPIPSTHTLSILFMHMSLRVSMSTKILHPWIQKPPAPPTLTQPHQHKHHKNTQQKRRHLHHQHRFAPVFIMMISFVSNM